MRSSSLFGCMLLPFCLFKSDIKLVEDHKTEYVIVTPENASSMELAAVKDMQALLKESSGADFAVVEPKDAENHRNRIFVGFSGAMKDAAGEFDEPKIEERVYRSIDGDIFIYGGGQCGTVFAVYQFLEEQLNFKFFHFWGDKKLPSYKDITLKPLDRRFIPSYLLRDTPRQAYWNLAGCPTSNDYFRRIRIHSAGFRPLRHIGTWAPHTYNLLIPPLKGMGYEFLKDKAYFETNPEYFPLTENGKREHKGQHRCFSNPALRRTMIENIEKLVQDNKMAKDDFFTLDVSHDDVDVKFCYCRDCEALEAKYKAPGGPLFDFLIEDASPYFKERYPNMKIRFLVYGRLSTEIPPAKEALKGGRLPDNLLPYIAFITGDFSKPFDKPANKFIYDCLKGWSNISDNLFLYYYPTTHVRIFYHFPVFGNVLRPVTDYKIACENGARYVFNDSDESKLVNNAGFGALQVYLEAKISEDVSLDVNRLVAAYMDGMYGAAAEQMTKYFYELEELGAKDPNFITWNAHPLSVDYLTPANLVRWQKCFDEMERSAEKCPRFLLNVQCARMNLDLMTLLLYPQIQMELPSAGLEPDAIHRRTVKIMHEIMARSYGVDHPGGVSRQVKQKHLDLAKIGLLDTADFYYEFAKGGKPLPREFARIPKQDIRQLPPGVMKIPLPRDKDAAFGGAVVAPVTNGSSSYAYGNFSKTVPDDGTGTYSCHYLGRTKLTRNAVMYLPSPQGTETPYQGQAVGALGSVYFGQWFDPRNPDQEWDIYISCRFKHQQIHTDRIIIVKASSETMPLFTEGIVRQPSASAVVAMIDKDSTPEWERITPLAPWKGCLEGTTLKSSPAMKLACDSGKLYLDYIEHDVSDGQNAGFWTNCVELLFYGDASYPLLQANMAPSGELCCYIHERIVTSDPDSADGYKIVSKKAEFPGTVSASIKDGVWTWRMAIPLDRLPAFAKDQIHANFFRSYPGGRPDAAWSPTYISGHRNGISNFGTLYFGHIALTGKDINKTPSLKNKSE